MRFQWAPSGWLGSASGNSSLHNSPSSRIESACAAPRRGVRTCPGACLAQLRTHQRLVETESHTPAEARLSRQAVVVQHPHTGAGKVGHRYGPCDVTRRLRCGTTNLGGRRHLFVRRIIRAATPTQPTACLLAPAARPGATATASCTSALHSDAPAGCATKSASLNATTGPVAIVEPHITSVTRKYTTYRK